MRLDRAGSPRPRIVRPFGDETLAGLRSFAASTRLWLEATKTPYDDAGRPAGSRYNRWGSHNPPLCRDLHLRPGFVALASRVFGRKVKPSYCFLSLYGPDGVCPRHVDRPQCRYTVDLLVGSDGAWPIYVSGRRYVMRPGEALCYSGTEQPHQRKPMDADGDATFSDLVFFHFVPAEWRGSLD